MELVMKNSGHIRYFCSVLLLLTYLIQGASSQKITLEPYRKPEGVTECVEGLVEGNTLLFYGTLDTTGVDIGRGNDQWSEKFHIATKFDPNVVYKDICSISAYAADCQKPTTNPICYCRTATDRMLHYVVNYTASTTISDNLIQAEWLKNDIDGEPVRSEERRVPTIYAQISESLNVKRVNNAYSPDWSMESGESYNIQWCVDSLKSPYTIEIQLEDKQLAVTTTARCAQHDFEAKSTWSGHSLTFAYHESTGCQRAGEVTKHISVYYPADSNREWYFPLAIFNIVVGVVGGTGCIIACIFSKRRERDGLFTKVTAGVSLVVFCVLSILLAVLIYASVNYNVFDAENTEVKRTVIASVAVGAISFLLQAGVIISLVLRLCKEDRRADSTDAIRRNNSQMWTRETKPPVTHIYNDNRKLEVHIHGDAGTSTQSQGFLEGIMNWTSRGITGNSSES